MPKILNRDNEIKKLENNLTLVKLVKEHFSNYQLKLHNENYVFVDKSVNKLFNSFSILETSFNILPPRLRLEVTYNIPLANSTKFIKVESTPKSCKLLDVLTKNNNPLLSPDIILRYHKPIFKSTDKELQHTLMTSCNLQIIKIIKNYPHAKLDLSSFPNTIKKLLAFI